MLPISTSPVSPKCKAATPELVEFSCILTVPVLAIFKYVVLSIEVSVVASPICNKLAGLEVPIPTLPLESSKTKSPDPDITPPVLIRTFVSAPPTDATPSPFCNNNPNDAVEAALADK